MFILNEILLHGVSIEKQNAAPFYLNNLKNLKFFKNKISIDSRRDKNTSQNDGNYIIPLELLHWPALLMIAWENLCIVTSVDRYFGMIRRNWSIKCRRCAAYLVDWLSFQCLYTFTLILLQVQTKHFKMPKKGRKYDYIKYQIMHTGYVVVQHADIWLSHTTFTLNCAFHVCERIRWFWLCFVFFSEMCLGNCNKLQKSHAYLSSCRHFQGAVIARVCACCSPVHHVRSRYQ